MQKGDRVAYGLPGVENTLRKIAIKLPEANNTPYIENVNTAKAAEQFPDVIFSSIQESHVAVVLFVDPI